MGGDLTLFGIFKEDNSWHKSNSLKIPEPKADADASSITSDTLNTDEWKKVFFNVHYTSSESSTNKAQWPVVAGLTGHSKSFRFFNGFNGYVYLG